MRRGCARDVDRTLDGDVERLKRAYDEPHRLIMERGGAPGERGHHCAFDENAFTSSAAGSPRSTSNDDSTARSSSVRLRRRASHRSTRATSRFSDSTQSSLRFDLVTQSWIRRQRRATRCLPRPGRPRPARGTTPWTAGGAERPENLRSDLGTDVEDLDFERGAKRGRSCAGGKRKIIPLAPRTLRALDLYLDERAAGADLPRGQERR